MHEAMCLSCHCCWHGGHRLASLPHWTFITQAHFSRLQRPGVLWSPQITVSRHEEQPFPIGQTSTRLLTPASPSLPIRPELVLSGISGGIQQRDLGQSFSAPFPLWPPALAALPLLVIVRGVPGRQWAIQRAGPWATSPVLCA